MGFIMIKFTQNDYVDIDKYEERLRYNGYLTCDKVRMNNIYLYNRAHSDSLAAMARDTMRYHSGAMCGELSKGVIYRYLQRYEGCPEHYFYSKNVQGISIDSKRVLGPLYQNGYAKEFLEFYTESRSIASKCNKIKTLLEQCNTEAGKDSKGNTLTRIPYNVNQQQNLRYNYKNYDVIGIPKEYSSTIGVEDGYVLAWGDFAQSDFRIAFNLLLRDSKNTEFMASIDDKYEGLARLIAEKNNTQFNKEEFLAMRKTYKTMTLATMYGTRNSMVKEERDFITMLSAYLEQCPKYAEFVKRINDKIELGLPFTLTSYFGHQEWIPIVYRKEDTLHKALNTPIQSGTSEVVILVVNKILDLFYDLGYTEEDISVYLVRHDEPIFKMKKEVLKDAWIFEEVSKIIIDNWVPLQLDFSFGEYYKVEDPELTDLARRSIKKNSDKITIIEQSDITGSEYYPIQPVAHVSSCAIEFEHDSVKKTALVFVSEDLKIFDLKVLKSTDTDVVYSAFMNYLDSLENIIDGTYTGMLVYTNIVDKEFCFKDRTYAKISKCTNTSTGFAQTIGSHLLHKFYDVDISYNESMAIEGLKDLKRFDLKPQVINEH